MNREDMNFLARNSNESERIAKRQKMELVDAYYTIGYVWAERASMKGLWKSLVKCPIGISKDLQEKFMKNGFWVSEYNKDFDGEKFTLNGFFIQWDDSLSE